MIEEYWWISWANVHYHEGYLGQMCIIMRDILGICAILWDILGKCAIQRGIYWANVQYKEGYMGQMCNYIHGNLITQERRRRKVSGHL